MSRAPTSRPSGSGNLRVRSNRRRDAPHLRGAGRRPAHFEVPELQHLPGDLLLSTRTVNSVRALRSPTPGTCPRTTSTWPVRRLGQHARTRSGGPPVREDALVLHIHPVQIPRELLQHAGAASRLGDGKDHAGVGPLARPLLTDVVREEHVPHEAPEQLQVAGGGIDVSAGHRTSAPLEDPGQPLAVVLGRVIRAVLGADADDRPVARTRATSSTTFAWFWLYGITHPSSTASNESSG